MQYIFIESIKGNKITDKLLLNQIGRVLRGRVGDKLYFINGKGKRDLVELTGFSKKEISFKLLESTEGDKLGKIIRLFQVLPKFKPKWEFILQKGTELGVSEFIPLTSDFCQAKYKVGTERELLILKEATEQSERLFLPKIQNEISFTNIFNEYSGFFYFFDSSDQNLPTQFDILSEFKLKNEINLIIGPEGGFSKNEIEFIKKQNNCKLLSLGGNILRLETASIVALSRLL